MAIITNTHHKPLSVHGVLLQPDTPTPVHNWDKIKKSAVVAAWVKAKVLVEVGDLVGPSKFVPTPSGQTAGGKEGAANLPTDKDELIARLAAHGIKKGKNSKVETLQAALVEAEAKQAEG